MSVPISNVVRRVVFAPSGTGPYAFTFEILAATDIQVYKGDTLLTLTTDYSVTINTNGTGSVTLVSTAGTDNITIVGARTIQRTTDFVTGGDLFANSLNTELDSLTIFTQQNSEANVRSIKAPVTDPTTINMTLPTKTARANKVLSFNSSTGNPETTITVTAINNAASDAAAAAASASAAAASASSASSSATSATNSASSATSSASSATSSASAASASASAASTSETNAASSASAASTSASNASTSASNASTSASNASTSATNAANSATAAQTAQTAAESARDSTLAAFDSFDDRYLGSKTSDPALDNDGNALVAGALYFNSVDGIMKVYTGSAWVAAYVSGTGFVDLSSAQTITGIKTFDNGLKTDTISEETAAAGVTVDGVLLKDNQVSTDQINEKTSAAGVTVDSVLLKDGLVGIGADGTASAPSIYRASDTNTGLFFPAADTIGLAAGGVEAARLVSGLFSIPANSTAASAVRLYEDTDNGTNYVDIIAPSAITSDRTLTIPDASGTIDRLNRAGNVLQVVSATKTDTASTTSNSFADITGMSVSITPTSTSNKILVLCSFNGGSPGSNNLGIQLVRDSTAIGIGTSATNNQVNVSGGLYESDANSLSSITASVLDSPNTTSATTYKVQFRVGASGTAYINRPGNDTNDNFIQRAASTITVMEIAG